MLIDEDDARLIGRVDDDLNGIIGIELKRSGEEWRRHVQRQPRRDEEYRRTQPDGHDAGRITSTPFPPQVTPGIGAVRLLAGGLFEDAAGQPTLGSQPKPEGEMRWALYVTLSPVWFDPGEVVGLITPFWVLYAIHDALVKPMPGNLMAPSRPSRGR